MTSPPEDVWDVIRRDLAIRLKTAGFTRKGRRFRLLRGASVACVDVQRSRFGGGDFTIEVGVYFPEVVRLLDEAPLAEFPALEDCLLSHRERLPFLGPDGRDRWWIVPPRNSDLVVPPGYLGGSQPGTREALARYIADLW